MTAGQRYRDLVAEHLPITAHHEAGHAVMRWSKGMAFRYVTIRSRRVLGQVALWKPRPISVWDMGDIAAAGPIAELHYLGRWIDDVRIIEEIDAAVDFAEEEGDDWASGDHVAFGRAIPRYEWLRTWRATESAVKYTLWPAVEAVAQGLLASPRALTYREVAELADAALE